MLIRNIKTSKHLKHAEPVEIATIVREVKQQGFYSAFCVNLIGDIAEHDALISEIQQMATRANLRVTFNAEESICIFEAY
jgi:hypothetical protein